MKFVDDEINLHFVFLLSHLGPTFWVLAIGYVIRSATFLAEISQAYSQN
jgi:hypothetical protein